MILGRKESNFLPALDYSVEEGLNVWICSRFGLGPDSDPNSKDRGPLRARSWFLFLSLSLSRYTPGPLRSHFCFRSFPMPGRTSWLILVAFFFATAFFLLISLSSSGFRKWVFSLCFYVFFCFFFRSISSWTLSFLNSTCFGIKGERLSHHVFVIGVKGFLFFFLKFFFCSWNLAWNGKKERDAISVNWNNWFVREINEDVITFNW